MPGTSRTPSRLLRAVAVGWLCLATPAVQDILMDAVTWAAGGEVCTDDCDDTETCTQQCGHCVCSAHAGLVPEARTGLTSVAGVLFSPASQSAMAQSGHLEPPFRPPVS